LKASELQIDSSNSMRLLALNIDLELFLIQKAQKEEIIPQSQRAFESDGQLGHLDFHTPIPLKERAMEDSPPPFHSLSTNREIISGLKQLTLLEVIEPFRNPGAAPTFIVYQSSKPRMVVNYRMLIIIANGFPLPKWNEVLQPLPG
jgi:hypothetical protein